MPLATVGADLDPAQFVVVPHVAALDTFRMTNDDGTFVADITEKYLDKLIAHMAEREAATGDLCPIVIGHTMNGVPETEQPPLVGFARNWHKGILGATGRPCAFFDAWVNRDKVELAKQYPRRSCEVWASRYEVDPISLLGATTPARDLGLMKLSREGSLTYSPPGEMTMPEETKKPDPKESGEAKGVEGKLDQILGLLTQLLQAGPAAPDAAAAGAAPAAGAPGAEAQPGGEMSDDEFNQMMQELMAEKGNDASRKAEPEPVKNDGTCYPNGQASTVIPNPHAPAKMSRETQIEQELADLRAQVSRSQVREALTKLQRPDIANPDDATLVEDLVAMPPELRNRQIERISKTPRAPGDGNTHLQRALDSAQPNGSSGKKRLTNREELTRLQRRAINEKKTFEQVAGEEGYDLS